jgi:uncharacterized membrane protein YccC
MKNEIKNMTGQPRLSDRIFKLGGMLGLVIFGAVAQTLSPLSLVVLLLAALAGMVAVSVAMVVESLREERGEEQ